MLFPALLEKRQKSWKEEEGGCFVIRSQAEDTGRQVEMAPFPECWLLARLLPGVGWSGRGGARGQERPKNGRPPPSPPPILSPNFPSFVMRERSWAAY